METQYTRFREIIQNLSLYECYYDMILIISSFFIEFQFSSDMDYITVYDGTDYHIISNMAHGIAKHKIFGKGNRLLVSLYFNDTIQLFAKMEFKVCKYQ